MKLLIDIPEHIYEHAKETTEDSRDEFDAMRAIANGTPQEGCGDAISRQAVLDIITFEDKWLFDANGHNANTHIAFSGLESRVKALPSVTPQQRTGCWIGADVLDKIRAEIDQYLFQNEFGSAYRKEVSQIIDKYKAGSEDKK